MSRPRVYYNEFDRDKAAWLRELIARDLIAPGDVDERSIADVRPDDLRGYRQCHFFAGIGIWSYALRLAGWEDEREVWTGSCPCPSFSAAGKGEGFDDPRHLWPVWDRLIGERRPPVLFGEQADMSIGFGWIDLVQTDLEKKNYAVGKAVLGACSVGAPHRRQRLYFVADTADANGWAGERGAKEGTRPDGERRRGSCRGGMASLLEHPESLGRIGRENHPDSGRGECSPGYRGEDGGLADAEHGAQHFGTWTPGREGRQREAEWGGSGSARSVGSESGRPGPLNGFWRDADWIFCRDRKWRPVGPGSFPLVNGAPARMVRLRGYGDGITAQAAEAFIRAYMEVA